MSKNQNRALAATRDAVGNLNSAPGELRPPYSRPQGRNLAWPLTPRPTAASTWVYVRASDIPPRARSPELVSYVAELTAASLRLATPPAYIAGNSVRQIGQRLHSIRWQGRQWAVTTYGVERRDGTYAISFDRLEVRQWIQHLAGKTSVDLSDFAEALRIARRIRRGGDL
jgi:hypothetical protein